jgi:very-short-patch-repair endonuclease
MDDAARRLDVPGMTAQQWCKVASDLDTSPKIRRAGRNGREVFLFVLRRNARAGNSTPGQVSAKFLEPWYLADQLMMPEFDAAAGVEAAIRANLIAIRDDVCVIVGWNDDEWGRGKPSRSVEIRTESHNPSSSCGYPIESPIEVKLWEALKATNDRAEAVFFAAGPRVELDTQTLGITGAIVEWQSPVPTRITQRASVFRHVRIGRYTADILVTYALGTSLLAIECDGRKFHDRTAEQATHDRARDRALLALKIPTVRFSGSEIHHDAMQCARDVWAIVCGVPRG